MKFRPPGGMDLDRIGMGMDGAEATEMSYADQRRELIETRRSKPVGGARQAHPPFGKLIVEEAFDLMNATIYGRGLEEEPQTAAFMGSNINSRNC
jgi:hypothetical protein